MILKEISTQRRKFHQAVFSHERHEANTVAHNLAHLATTLDTGDVCGSIVLLLILINL
jgi:hypothetical protein